MEANERQIQLFSHLKKNLPPHLSLVDELGDLLNLSNDSVYRRIRGEKPVSLNELKQICAHFHLSLDHLLNLQNETVTFHAPGINGKYSGLASYLEGMLLQFQYFNSFKIREMQYLCKDIPFWYFYLFPEMGAFKTFFWIRNIHNDPEFIDKKFSLEDHVFSDCFELGQKILTHYNNIPSVEIWNLESIHSTINQIAYYKDAGIFKNPSDIRTIIDSFHHLLDHISMQSEKGVKFLPGASELTYRSSVQVYVNELILGNNTILVSLDNNWMSIITHSVLSYLITKDERFASRSVATFNALSSRSSLISKTGEKERIKFFNILHDKVSCLNA